MKKFTHPWENSGGEGGGEETFIRSFTIFNMSQHLNELETHFYTINKMNEIIWLHTFTHPFCWYSPVYCPSRFYHFVQLFFFTETSPGLLVGEEITAFFRSFHRFLIGFGCSCLFWSFIMLEGEIFLPLPLSDRWLLNTWRFPWFPPSWPEEKSDAATTVLQPWGWGGGNLGDQLPCFCMQYIHYFNYFYYNIYV